MTGFMEYIFWMIASLGVIKAAYDGYHMTRQGEWDGSRQN